MAVANAAGGGRDLLLRDIEGLDLIAGSNLYTQLFDLRCEALQNGPGRNDSGDRHQ